MKVLPKSKIVQIYSGSMFFTSVLKTYSFKIPQTWMDIPVSQVIMLRVEMSVFSAKIRYFAISSSCDSQF